MITVVWTFLFKDKHYSRIEAQNNINVNVFGYKNKQFYPVYVSTGSHEELNLLLISDGEKLHYVLIKSFNSLMHNKTKHKNTKHVCMHCLQAFSSKEILTKHKENCLSINGIQGIQMPKKGSKVEFKDHHKQMPVPFVIYADFDAITEKVSGCQQNEEKSYTDKHQHHTGLYLEGRFNGGFFALPDWGGLYLEVLIHGGAYFRNFTVRYLTT